MRSRRPRSGHQQAVALRLAQLSDDLAAGRAAAVAAPPGERPVAEPPLVERPPAAVAGEEWWGDHTRVAPAVRTAPRPGSPLRLVPDPAPTGAPVPPAPAPMPVVPAVPVPGRHAARRRGDRPGERLTDLLPDQLPGRAGEGREGREGRVPRTARWALGPGQVAVMAVLVAIGALVTAVLVVRHDPAPAEPTLAAAPAEGLVALPAEPPEPVEPADPASAALPEGQVEPQPAAAGGTPVTVDVAGRVRRPGIAVLEAGARVVDALEAAGGARPGVDLSTLNLARPLVDGEQILVGEQAAAAPAAVAPVPPGATGPAGAPTAPVALNTATAADLDLLPEVGPVTAAAILAWRDEHGGFTAVEELLEVDGIGDVTFGRIAPHVTL